MNQELKEKLHYYLPYGLPVVGYPYVGLRNEIRMKNPVAGILVGMHPTHHTLQLFNKGGEAWDRLFDVRENEYQIKMRPLPSLTKEIVVPGYNDGKPFVPMKILHSDEYGDFGYWSSNYNPTPRISSLSLDCLELLLKWHFWLWDQSLFDTGEIIKIEG